jgi:hypothetical protein
VQRTFYFEFGNFNQVVVNKGLKLGHLLVVNEHVRDDRQPDFVGGKLGLMLPLLFV